MIVTLTTDFGTTDHYTGTMKGVILSRCPSAQVIDITHGVPPFSVHAGAYTIWQAAPFFPPGTIHVVVVDPGVGTSRKPMLLRAAGQIFIAPDNGVLSFPYLRDEGRHAREITNSALFLPNVSNTFHGRDIFSAVAGAIASGTAHIEDVGPELTNPVLLSDLEPRSTGEQRWTGIALSVDHFGNVITNFHSARFGSNLAIQCGPARVDRFYASFGSAPERSVFAYHGSSGYIELGINRGNAAQHLSIAPGDEISLFQ